MNINIHATGIELTPALRAYAEEKIGGLTKFFENIQLANIDIGMRGNHHNKGNIFYAEVNLDVPGHIIRVEKEEVDLYKAIDKVKDHLKVELEKVKEKMRRIDKEDLRDQKEYHDDAV